MVRSLADRTFQLRFEDVYAAKLKKMKAEKADQEAARDAKRREVERKRMKSLAALDPAMAAQLEKKPSKEVWAQHKKYNYI